jgi:MerR family regulatory protein
MKAEVLKGHLDALLLAILEAGPRHGYAIIDAVRANSAGRIDLPPAPSTRPSTAWRGMALTVSALADEAGLSADTVRCYERVGLLPKPTRSAAGYRLYD